MRNFPHQVNQIHKFVGALRVAADLREENLDLTDDGLYGYALAEAGIYSFRGLADATPEELRARIASEQSKPRGSQGARTFARDVRRTLLLLGFFERTPDQIPALSASGSRILALGDDLTDEGRQLWTHALISMQLRDSSDEASIHPALAMLRIATERPGVEKKWLALALDMRDASQQELERTLELIDQGNFEQACNSLEISEYEAANAVKIIPSLLEQVGLIRLDSAHCVLTARGHAILGGRPATVTEAPSAHRRRYGRPRRAGRLVRAAADIPIPAPSEPPDARTPDEQIHSALRLEERTREHQELVRLIVSQLRNVQSIRCSEDAFDLLAEAADDTILLLLEMKTVRFDGLIQARVGAGQLLYYEFFDVQPVARGRRIVKVLVFDQEPGDEVRAFLQHCGLLCILVLAGLLTTIPTSLLPYFSEIH